MGNLNYNKDLNLFIGAVKSAVEIIDRKGQEALMEQHGYGVDAYSRYHDSVDNGLKFLIEWLEEVQKQNREGLNNEQ